MNETAPPTRRLSPSLSAQTWIVFGLALAVRLAYFAEQSYKPYFGAPLLDARYLAEQAIHLLHHGALPPGPLFRPPLYTLFITPLTALLPNAPVAPVALVQHLLGAFWAVLVLWTGRRAGGATAGFCAGLLAALYAPSIFYEGEMLSDSATLWLTSAMVLTWIDARSRTSLRSYAFSGILAGLAAITRPTALLPAAALAAGALVSCTRKRPIKKSGLSAVAVFLLPVALITAIPTIYNSVQGDSNFIASQGGINFWLGNNPAANGVNVIVPPVSSSSGNSAYRDSVDTFSREALLESGNTKVNELSPSQISRIWYSKSFDWLLHHPSEALRLQALKIVAAFNDHEVRNNRGFDFARHHESWVLRFLPITFGFVFTLAIIGITALPSLPHSNRRAAQWVLLSGAATFVGIIAFFVAGRLRLPLVGAFIPIAGVGVARLLHLIKSPKRNAIIATATIFVVAAFITYWHWPVLDFRLSSEQPEGLGLLATDHDGMENSLLAQGSLLNNQPLAAMGYAFKAAHDAPALPYAHALLGESAIAANEPRTAAIAFLQAAGLEPLNASHYANSGVAFEAIGRFSLAAEFYHAALELDPTHAQASANLAMLFYRAGDRAAARELATLASRHSPPPKAALAVLGQLPDNQIPPDMKQPLPAGTQLTAADSPEACLAHGRSLLKSLAE